MKNTVVKLCTVVLLCASVSACKKKDYGPNLGPVQDSVAEIPVTVTNANAFERYPVVYTSVAGGGGFTITMEIPAEKGKIKEITRVVTGPAVIANYTNLNLTTATTALNTTGAGTTASPFALSPIAGNGSNQITFKGNIGASPTADVFSYLPYRIRNGAPYGVAGPQVGPPTAPGGPATGPVTAPVSSTTTVPTDIQFYFLITLEDNRTIVPLPVRVRVNP